MSWIVETLLASALLMALVLLAREPVARIFGPRVAYMLWLLPALRMILPPIPQGIADVPAHHLPQAFELATAALPIEMATLGETPISGSVDVATMALALWLAGAFSYFLWHVLAYHRFVRHALDGAIELPELDRDGIEVCASKVVDGPVATGVLLQRIVLPHDWRSRYDEIELRLAMLHETTHHRRGDLSVNYLALAILSLHWFNPLAYRAWRAFRTDQELACDAIVLERAGGGEKHSYGLALVKSACNRTPVTVCALNPRDQLKQRLRMMRDVSAPGVGSRALAIALIGSGLALTASGGFAAERTRKIVVEQADIVENAIPEIAAPAPIESARFPAPSRRVEDAIAPAGPVAPISSLATPIVPPAPPVPPIPPIAPNAPDLSEVRAAASAARTAHAQAEHAVAEAMKVVRSQTRLVTRTVAIAASPDCDGVARAIVTTNGNGQQVNRAEYCVPDAAGIRHRTRDALVQARSALDRDHALDASARAHAVVSLDRQIAALSRK